MRKGNKISYNTMISNETLNNYFGVEDADTYVDKEEEGVVNGDYLGDYDLAKYEED